MTRPPAKTRDPVRGRAINDASPTYSRDGNHRTTEGGRGENYGMALKPLRCPAVRERTGLSRSTIWRLERRGAFPQHHRISSNAVAWVEDEVAN
jgi:predicted DNA-binding transcriptional regulator AlpA